MKKTILFILTLTLLSTAAHAQDYKTALGLRIGPYYGVTLKHFLNETRALEGILLTRKGGFSFTGLYEIHTQAFSVKSLNAYGGIGAHINIFEDRNRDYWNWDDDNSNGWKFGNDSRFTAGIDMILGLEYTIDKLPFNIGLDWKPALNLIGDHGISVNQVALSFRFVF